MADAPAPAAPKSSARVAVPLPPAVVACVKQCAEAAPLTPDALRTAITRLLLCAQWPAGDEDVLQLLPHEAAALTWYATPAVWVKTIAFCLVSRPSGQRMALLTPSVFIQRGSRSAQEQQNGVPMCLTCSLRRYLPSTPKALIGTTMSHASKNARRDSETYVTISSSGSCSLWMAPRAKTAPLPLCQKHSRNATAQPRIQSPGTPHQRANTMQ